MSEAHTQNGSSNGHSSMPSTARLTTTPFAASRKVHVDGSLPGVRVPMREISLTPTHSANGKGETPNQPVTVYDTSGPYTDPNITIDVRAGLPPLRRAWIDSRQDVEELPQVTSQYGRLRAADPKLTDLRFEHIRQAASRQSRTERQPDALCQTRVSSHRKWNSLPFGKTNPATGLEN